MNRNEKLQVEIRDLTSQIDELKGEVRGLRRERESLREEMSLSDRVVGLKEEIVELEIQQAKLTEKHEREQREVTHKVGLERKRSEFETEQAKREAIVEIRETNLAADRERFEEQMKFHEDRFAQEVGYLKELVEQVLSRLPTVTVDKTVTAKASR